MELPAIAYAIRELGHSQTSDEHTSPPAAVTSSTVFLTWSGFRAMTATLYPARANTFLIAPMSVQCSMSVLCCKMRTLLRLRFLINCSIMSKKLTQQRRRRTRPIPHSCDDENGAFHSVRGHFEYVHWDRIEELDLFNGETLLILYLILVWIERLPLFMSPSATILVAFRA